MTNQVRRLTILTDVLPFSSLAPHTSRSCAFLEGREREHSELFADDKEIATGPGSDRAGGGGIAVFYRATRAGDRGRQLRLRDRRADVSSGRPDAGMAVADVLGVLRFGSFLQCYRRLAFCGLLHHGGGAGRASDLCDSAGIHRQLPDRLWFPG